jgi:ABC-type molybdenum transport system ATPase subunit/photorepair protein PhrA
MKRAVDAAADAGAGVVAVSHHADEMPDRLARTGTLEGGAITAWSAPA